MAGVETHVAAYHSRMSERVLCIPVVRTDLPGGAVMFRPGEPILERDEVSVREAGRLLHLSQRRIASLCDEGKLKSAHKPGGRQCSGWRILKSEVLAERARRRG
jgi:hypothetical protein